MNKNINIQQETEKDYPKIYTSIHTAFQTAKVKNEDETLIKKTSFNTVRSMEYKAICLCENLNYYHKFRFLFSSLYNIWTINNVPDDNPMIYKLIPNSFKNIKGY
jgi:predicted N-acetyltransferase YhbS